MTNDYDSLYKKFVYFLRQRWFQHVVPRLGSQQFCLLFVFLKKKKQITPFDISNAEDAPLKGGIDRRRPFRVCLPFRVGIFECH